MDVVNGYPCKTCTDVELARKGVDPARPNDGPSGLYKTDREEPPRKPEAARQAADDKPVDYGPAVKFDGALAGAPRSEKPREQPAYIPGTVADLRA